MTRGAVLRQALALALGAAVALGLARFAYALLLGPMRADLGWTYFTAGVMNTGNAAGYLLGALAMPRALLRFGPRACALAGGFATALLLALHGGVSHDGLLLALRLASGAASAATFVGGGLLAARLGSQAAAAPAGARALPGAGLVLGLYYGGTGLGIVASALLVPVVMAWAGGGHAWQPAWLALGAVAVVMTMLLAAGTPADAPPPAATAQIAAVPWRRMLWALAGYACFGLGYIGYMTFIISLLREQRLGEGAITGFYVLLGLGVVASSWLWSGLLQRFKGGQPLALLNGLLALATLLPVLSTHPAAVFGSGALFGAVFLSVVASTTALVRHNLPAAAWPRGITGFTIVFAVGQIVGPSVVGLIADGPGGLARGLAISAGLLALGSVLAALQRPLAGAQA
jgi:predicted MFS family arabinose efflux permease